MLFKAKFVFKDKTVCWITVLRKNSCMISRTSRYLARCTRRTSNASSGTETNHSNVARYVLLIYINFEVSISSIE